MLKTNGVHLQPHEFHTVKILLDKGLNIELLPTSQIRGVQTPDIMMNGQPWEIKSPEGGSKNTIKHNIQNAAHQCENVIIDLFRCKLDNDYAMKEIQHHFLLSKRIKRLKIVTRSEIVIDFQK